MKLYEIDSKISDFLENNIDFETGEIQNLELFEKLTEEKNVKIENIALAYKNALSNVDELKREKQSFEDREKKAKNKAESLKKYLEFALKGEKFQTSKVDIKYRKSEVLSISEDATIPNEYLTIKKPEPNKTEIKKAIKNGTVINGITIETKQNIQIK